MNFRIAPLTESDLTPGTAHSEKVVEPTNVVDFAHALHRKTSWANVRATTERLGKLSLLHQDLQRLHEIMRRHGIETE